MTYRRFSLADGTVGFACGGPRRALSCSVPGCGRLVTHLCDCPLPAGGTCDKPLCDAHRARQRRDRVPPGQVTTEDTVDFCPPHDKRQRQFDVELNASLKAERAR